jgi:hypothetical protein
MPEPAGPPPGTPTPAESLARQAAAAERLAHAAEALDRHLRRLTEVLDPGHGELAELTRRAGRAPADGG